MGQYVVTGCAGFIGSHVTDELLARGHAVIGIDAFTRVYERTRKEANLRSALTHPSFELHELDLVVAAWSHLALGCDGIFHLAARPGVRDSWGASFEDYVHANLLATQRVLETALQARVRVVFASSSSVYGAAGQYPTSEDVVPRPISPYGVSKLACESLIQAYGSSSILDAVSLRYFSVFGPRQRPDMAFTRILDAAVKQRAFDVNGSGEQSRDFTFVEDVVAATLLAMESAPRSAIYNVGGGTETSLRDAIALCEELVGGSVRIRRRAAGRGDPDRTAADTRRIRRELGWEPTTSLRDGLRAQLDWVLES